MFTTNKYWLLAALLAIVCIVAPSLRGTTPSIWSWRDFNSDNLLATPVHSPPPDDGLMHSYQDGMNLFRKGEYERAIQTWITFLLKVDHQDAHLDYEEVYTSALRTAQLLHLLYKEKVPLKQPQTLAILLKWLATCDMQLNMRDIISAYENAAAVGVLYHNKSTDQPPLGREALTQAASLYSAVMYNDECFEYAIEAYNRIPYEIKDNNSDGNLDTLLCACGYYVEGKEERGLEACYKRVSSLEASIHADGGENNPNDVQLLADTRDNIQLYKIKQREEQDKTSKSKTKEEEERDSFKLIDAFTFYNELDMLELRLRELIDVVDLFILVESTKTFAGNPKELVYDQNKDRFGFAAHKIRHIITDMPEGLAGTKDDAWVREAHQRNSILRGLTQDIEDEALVLISDVDEFPDVQLLSKFKYKEQGLSEDVIFFNQDMYYYTPSYKIPHRWIKQYISTAGILRNHKNTLDYIRGHPQAAYPFVAGFHFSYYFMDVETIINKIQQFSHQELNKPAFVNHKNIKEALQTGKDLFGRFDMELLHVPDTLPVGSRYLPRVVIEKFLIKEDGREEL